MNRKSATSSVSAALRDEIRTTLKTTVAAVDGPKRQPRQPEPQSQPETSRCENCEKVWQDSQLSAIEDVHERVAPGEPMPSGQCPECGAVCHPVAAANPLIVVAFVKGGIVEDIESSAPANCYAFDWDDFADSPLDYWEERDPELRAHIQAQFPERYRRIEKRLARARKEQQQQQPSV